ncbi:MAG: asparagine synthase C-terminal domain-containing protein [bacterium]|nr:asparagine synthase C-terminal domain-containing protein [bacterium]
MKPIIQLERKGWVTLEKESCRVFVRGQAHQGESFFNTEQLAELLLAQTEARDVASIINNLNGTWAFVWVNGDEIVFAVDHIRSIELLYHIDEINQTCFIFDNLSSYLQKHTFEFDEDVLHEYLSSGFAWREKTLIKGIYSVQAGEYVTILDHTLTRIDYFIPTPNLSNTTLQTEAIIGDIDETFCNAIKRLIQSVNGRRIVVPLSGGYDSRLVVNYLCKLGYKNILCYTYGAEKNLDSEYSKNVAAALGLPWHFVEYKGNVFLDGIEEKEIQDFCKFSCNGTNTPILQEFYALKSLKEHGIITEEDIVVPGHCLDILAGSDLSKACYSWCVASEIYGTSTKMFYKDSYSRTIKDLRCYVNENHKQSKKETFEVFSLRENITKVIYNAIRICEWFGLDWRMPWTDKEIISLWLNIPWKMRYGRVWFRAEVAPQLWVKELMVLPLHGYWSKQKLSLLKNIKVFVKEHIPYFLIRLSRGGHSINQKSLSQDVFKMWQSERVEKIKEACIQELLNRSLTSIARRLSSNFKALSMGGGVRALYVFLALASLLKINKKE